MGRRFIAILGMLAFAIAYLPADTEGLHPGTPDCCDGVLCPMMRHMANGGVICDMTHSPTTAFDCCPALAPQYTAALAMVRVAPPVLAAELPAGPAPFFILPLASHIDYDVVSPPPRASLA